MFPTTFVRLTTLWMGLGFAAPAFAAPALELVLRSESLAQGTLSGELHYQPDDDQAEVCFYLPFLDPTYVFDPARGYAPSIDRYGNVQKVPGRMQVQGATVSRITQPWLVRVPRGQDGWVRTSFRSRLPYWPDRKDAARWLFNDAYPQPLKRCPSAAESTLDYPRELGLSIKAQIFLPSGWDLVTPAEATSPAQEGQPWQLSFTGSKLAFVVSRHFLGEEIEVAGVKVRIAYHSQYFSQYVETIPRLVEEQVAINGPFPFKRLVILETDDLEKARIPGIVTVNQPKQANLLKDEKTVLHWTVWQLANFLGEQWMGSAITAERFDFDWFVRGNMDVTAYLALSAHPEWLQFFAPRDGRPPWLRLSYGQTTDLMAALLTYSKPQNRLTHRDLESAEPFHAQHPVAYARHALAMRYAEQYLGRERFISLWRDFIQTYQFRTVVPRDWVQFLHAQGESELAQVFVQWWSTSDWPDAELVDVRLTKTEQGANRVTVLARQSGAVVLPLTAAIQTADGKRTVIEGKAAGDGLWVAEFVTQSDFKDVELQPDRAVFDWNRFNNSSRDTEWQFFPGSARSFRDDAMTVLWLPLVAKLPGEEWTVLLASQIFRYMHNSVTVIGSYVPQEKRAGFRMFYLTDIPWWSLYTVMSASQNFGNQTRDERVLDAGVYRRGFFLNNPDLELGLRLRYRQVMGRNDTAHPTVALRAQLEPPNPQLCRYSFNIDLERTVPNVNERLSYARDTGKFQGNCQFFSLVGEVRTFYGVLTSEGMVPGNVAFQPQDLDGPRVRMEMGRLDSVHRIGSIGLDLLGPIRLPLENLFLALPRETRWRLFYDYARAPDAGHTYHDAGVGLSMPLGGDVVGKQTITLMRISVLAVLYQKYDDERGKKPALLLDVLGKL